ncbi:MAG: CbiX/SirB N-terminal domain-containing protein [Burkholderiales bacterium]|nr:CbiX/SirB N-terminal domain-containing protein [Burkholderiales bacterium]PZN05978.1 MAG: cobalamin biosynthesis protein CbiX [Pseudomonadota bacterium]
MKTGILLFAHGSRTREWAAPFERIGERIAARRSDTAVVCAYLELMSPDFHSAVDGLVEQGVARITVAPLFLASGSHVQHDLPRLVEEAIERHPQLRIRVLPVIGEAEALLDAIAAWVADQSFEG